MCGALKVPIVLCKKRLLLLKWHSKEVSLRRHRISVIAHQAAISFWKEPLLIHFTAPVFQNVFLYRKIA
jgi:hypothetical protein